MPGRSRQQASDSAQDVSSDVEVAEESTPDHGNAANAEELAGGDEGGGGGGSGGDGDDAECEIDRLAALQEAVAADDGSAALEHYGALDPEQHATLLGDTGLVTGLLGVVARSEGATAARNVAFDLCITLPELIKMLHEADALTETVANSLLSGATVEEQVSVVDDAEALEAVFQVCSASPAYTVFALLADDDERFVDAVKGNLGPWAFLRDEDVGNAMAEVDGALYPKWIQAFQTHSTAGKLLDLMAVLPGEAWTDAFKSDGGAFTWLATNAGSPLQDQHVEPFLAMFNDGDGFTTEQSYTAFGLVWGEDLMMRDDWDRDVGAVNSTTGASGRLHKVYNGNDPNADAMRFYFEQFRQIPRSQVMLATGILMADYYRKKWVPDAAGASTQWLNAGSFDTEANATQHSLSTSFYTGENIIVMRSKDSSGTPDDKLVKDVGVDEGRSGLAVNRTGQGTDEESENPNLSMFQNHATHEIGHAVGVRTLDKAPLGGKSPDDYTKDTYSWGAGSAEGFARTLGFTAAMDGTKYTLTDAAGAIEVKDVEGTVIRDLLTGYSKGDSPAPAELVGADKFADTKAVLDALANHDDFKDLNLFKTVKALKGKPDNAYLLPFGVEEGDVHFFCTRWTDDWVKYDKKAYDERPSHYAVSSYREYFAEAYTEHYTGGKAPDSLSDVFTTLDSATADDYGDLPGVGGSPGADASVTDGGEPGEEVDVGTGLVAPLPEADDSPMTV